jgi:hypothetical protein
MLQTVLYRRRASTRFSMSSKQAKADIPPYRGHKARNLAVVTLSGIDFYLGRYGVESPRAKRCSRCHGKAAPRG